MATQVEMYGAVGDFLERVTMWLLRNLPLPLDIERMMKEIAPGIAEIAKNKDALHSDTTRDAAEKLYRPAEGAIRSRQAGG